MERDVTPLVIREASEEDLAAVLQIYAQPELDDGIVFSLQEAKNHFKRLKNDHRFRLFVAVMDQRVVGTFSFLLLHSLAKRGAPAAVAEDLGVHPDYHSRGIGRAMLEHARTIAHDAGCHKLSVSTNARREKRDAAYGSLGFQREGYTLVIKP